MRRVEPPKLKLRFLIIAAALSLLASAVLCQIDVLPALQFGRDIDLMVLGFAGLLGFVVFMSALSRG